MKNAVKSKKPAVKQKAKSLAPVKSPAKLKPAATSRGISSVQKAEIAPQTSVAFKKSANGKIKSVSKQIEKPPTKKIVSKFPTKSAKALMTKTTVKKAELTAKTPTVRAKNKKAVIEKKLINQAAKQKPALNENSAEPKKIAKIIVKDVIKTAKPKIVETIVQKIPLRGRKDEIVSSQKTKKQSKIEKTNLAETKLIQTKKMPAQSVAVKTIKQKPNQVQTAAATKISKKNTSAKLNIQSKKTVVLTIKADAMVEPKKAAVEEIEFKPVEASENFVWKRLKFKPAIAAAKSTASPQKQKKQIIAEEIEPVLIVEPIKTPSPKLKKGKPIGSAVFRGKKARYGFKVFEIDEKLEPIPAVYIISKRKIDRNKKGHHAVLCIGQTTSIFDELKRHRKGKCVKKHRANVVSILPEADETTRIKIETDLKAAHSVVCNFE